MDVAKTIEELEAYKSAVVEWDRTTDSQRRQELRTYINQNKHAVRQHVIEAGCFLTLTISPPPAVGGLVMKNVDPFDVIFDRPYLMSLIPQVVDMIDQTTGVLLNPPKKQEQTVTEPSIDINVVENYAFIAMPMDPDDPELEDVLDAIKESAVRCGLQAERVDEPQTTERITDRILESLRQAEYVIVDLTHSKPNVYYEAGYAHGIGKIPIYLAREGTKLEFDLKDYPVIFFKNMKQLKDSLEKRIRGMAEHKQT